MASALATLLHATLVSSAALLLIGLLRTPLRHAFGARAAYWVWLLAPTSILGLSLPRPNLVSTATTQTISRAADRAWDVLPVAPTVSSHIDVVAIAGVLAWLTGVLVALGFTVLRQQRFLHALGPLSRAPDGTLRSAAIIMPLVVGAWSPRLIIPLDFERRYGESRRKLMLAHEAGHLARWDTRVAALAAGWVCIFWFNPLVYWAVSSLRLDQELACDAMTLAQFSGSGRDYAEALLEAQMANQIRVTPPAGCHWHSTHPLKTRITMLKRRMPGNMRMMSGVAVVIGISALASAVVWAVQPRTPAAGSQIVLSMIWFADHDPRFPGRIVRQSASNRLAGDGQELTSTNENYGVTCAPHALRPGTPQSDPTVSVRCKLSVDGRVFAAPGATVAQGRLLAFDNTDAKTGTRLYVVLNAAYEDRAVKTAN